MDTLLDTVTSLVSALILSSRTFLGRSLPLVSKDCLLAHSPNLFLKSSDGVRPSWWGCWARDYSRSTPPASRRSLNQVPIATCEWKIDKEPCFTPFDWLKGLITKNCSRKGSPFFSKKKVERALFDRKGDMIHKSKSGLQTSKYWSHKSSKIRLWHFDILYSAYNLLSRVRKVIPEFLPRRWPKKQAQQYLPDTGCQIAQAVCFQCQDQAE